MFVHYNRDGISLFDVIIESWLLDQKQTIVDGVAEEDPCKGFCDHALNSQCLNDLRRLLSGGATAKVLSCNNNISRLDLRCQFRAQRGKSVLFHIIYGFYCKVLCWDNDIRINIIS